MMGCARAASSPFAASRGDFLHADANPPPAMSTPTDIADADPDRPNQSAGVARPAALTDEILTQIRSEITRTGTGVMRLLRGAKEKPRGLTSNIVQTWLNGSVASASPLHVAFVLQRWSELPDAQRQALTSDMIATLEAEFARTGMGAVTVLARADDRPMGLTQQVIQGWLRGRTNTVGIAHWEFVMARLAALPDLSLSAPSHRVRRMARADIPPDDLAELRRHRERTGVGGAVLLRHAEGKPDGLTSSMISGWVTGAIRSARPDHLAYVLAHYRAWP